MVKWQVTGSDSRTSDPLSAGQIRVYYIVKIATSLAASDQGKILTTVSWSTIGSRHTVQ